MESLCKIRDIYRLIYDFELEFEKEHNLSLNEGMLLCTLLERSNITSGQISESLRLSTSNTSKVIKSLECKGFIKREIGAIDKRQMNFSLTNAGTLKITSIKSHKFEIHPSLDKIITSF